MKKILIVWIGVFLIFLVGCSKAKSQKEGAKESKKVAEITVNKCNIYTSPDSSSFIVAQAQQGDMFELEGEEIGYYKITMFSGEWRYVPKSAANSVKYRVSLPSDSVCRILWDTSGKIERQAMKESDSKYPPRNKDNINNNIEYSRILVDRYKLELFHKYRIQPLVYKEILGWGLKKLGWGSKGYGR